MNDRWAPMDSSERNVRKLPFLTRFFRAVAQDLVIPKGSIPKTKIAEAGGSDPPADKNDDN